MKGIWQSKISPAWAQHVGVVINVVLCVQKIRGSSSEFTPDPQAVSGWGRIKTQDFGLHPSSSHCKTER